jgi:excisionase family DNA binding protein
MSMKNFPLAEDSLLDNNPPVRLLSTTEAAAVLGVSVRRVRQLIAEGKISAHHLGRDYAIEESALVQVKVYGRAGRPPRTENGKDTQGGNNAKGKRRD